MRGIDYTMRDGKIQVTKGKYKPALYDIVKVRYEGDNFVTVKHQQRQTKGPIRWLTGKKYEVIKTGEIREADPDAKGRKTISFKNSMKRRFDELTGIIRANFVNEGEPGCDSQLFITLTYAENMTDEVRLYKDFKQFIQRLKRRFPDKPFEYVTVAEPQGRGAWHFHLMLKVTDGSVLFIDKEVITELWRHGYTTTERLKSDDIGQYYVTYFTGILGAGENNGSEDDVTGEEIYEYEQSLAEPGKRVVKGQRLNMYPKNFRFYRCSRGIVRPKYEKQMLNDIVTNELGEYEEVRKAQYDVVREFKDTAGTPKAEVLNRTYKATYKRRE